MNTTFEKDVIAGLTAPEKQLSSKYLYDANGSRIFQEIMNMPDYYLTNSEFEILALQAKQIVEACGFNKPFNIVELGAGDGFKTFKLLEHLVAENVAFNYMPIDISKDALDMLSKSLSNRLPGLSIKPQVGDYFEILAEMSETATPSLLLFLGSNIGNYLKEDALDLLKLFNSTMKTGDKLLIGMDLKKNPITIKNAYDDKDGITKRFNINLLIRMNRELEADFKLDDFDFYCYYNPETGRVKSYLVSLKQQSVLFKKLNKTIHFKQNELIWTELSKKYSLPEIEKLAAISGFEIKEHFLDCKHFFTDSLWEKP
ncbi:L-histidine N(alpha)-methyltransferase [Bizionia sediminis]|uniref:L-histidine N(Alpha)-methyltransferase n=1 Tax=Bizionia sediminis TaxID=1737064 RepID=A0ABW5KPZ7_9FLAO